MEKVDDIQTSISDFETKPVQLNIEAYAILRAVKNQLIAKYKKNFTFSDAVVELKQRANGDSVKFSRDEIAQIKTKLKGGL